MDEVLIAYATKHGSTHEVAETIAGAARSGNESGDGLVWTTPVDHVIHHRTGRPLEEAA